MMKISDTLTLLHAFKSPSLKTLWSLGYLPFVLAYSQRPSGSEIGYTRPVQTEEELYVSILKFVRASTNVIVYDNPNIVALVSNTEIPHGAFTTKTVTFITSVQYPFQLRSPTDGTNFLWIFFHLTAMSSNPSLPGGRVTSVSSCSGEGTSCVQTWTFDIRPNDDVCIFDEVEYEVCFSFRCLPGTPHCPSLGITSSSSNSQHKSF